MGLGATTKLFRTRLLLTYIAVILLPISLTVVILVFRGEKTEMRRFCDLMQQLNRQLLQNYSEIVRDLEQTDSLFYIDQRIIDIMSKQSYTTEAEYHQDLDYVKKVTRQSVSANNYLAGITFVGESGRFYDSTGSHESYLRALARQMQAESPQAGWSRSHAYRAKIHNREMTLITLSRPMRNPYLDVGAGYLHVTFSFERVFQAFRSDQEDGILEANGFLIIQQGALLYASRDLPALDAALPAIEQRAGAGGEAGFALEVDGTRYFFVAAHSPQDQLTMVQYLPLADIRRHTVDSLAIYLLALTAISALALLLGGMFSARLSGPVTRVIKAMGEIENQRYPQLKSIHATGEIKELAEGFNRMSRKLEQSIESQYKSAIAQKNLQMKLLQTQINPHFIYNTLNLISSMAQLENVPSISSASSALAHMLYYNLKAADMIPVSEEIAQIRRYIHIQKLRFPEKILDFYEIEPEADGCLILKFLLQPLVENAVYHGIEKKLAPGWVRISVTVRNGMLHIVVEDNGAGMPPETLAQLRQSFRRDPLESLLGDQGMYMGLNNVYSRLCTAYEGNCSFSVESRVDMGTRIEISIPAGAACKQEGKGEG